PLRRWRNAAVTAWSGSVDSRCAVREKPQIPGSKHGDENTSHQAPSTSKTPSPKLKPADGARRIGIWNLGFLWSLELGVWSLGRVRAHARARHRGESCQRCRRSELAAFSRAKWFGGI